MCKTLKNFKKHLNKSSNNSETVEIVTSIIEKSHTTFDGFLKISI